jgi:hypothetical protein
MQEKLPTCLVFERARVPATGATSTKRARVPSITLSSYSAHAVLQIPQQRGIIPYACRDGTLPRSHIQGALLLHQNSTCPLAALQHGVRSKQLQSTALVDRGQLKAAAPHKCHSRAQLKPGTIACQHTPHWTAACSAALKTMADAVHSS